MKQPDNPNKLYQAAEAMAEQTRVVRQERRSCEQGVALLAERVQRLEAALAPFARAYEELLDNEPTPDVAIVNYDMAANMYDDKHALVQWSDLFRAANLLREKKG